MTITNPNQKIVNVVKSECSRENPFGSFNLKALQNAMLDLSGETFKLWCYFSKNKDNYEFSLYKVDALNWGIGSKSSYDRGVATLIEKGYLI